MIEKSDFSKMSIKPKYLLGFINIFTQSKDGKSIKIEPKIHAVFHQKTGSLKIFKKLALEASRASFWRALGTSWAPWGRSWAPLGRFLGAFWMLLGVLLGVLGASWALKARFGSILEGSWGGLGVIWEPLGGLWAFIFAQNALITAGTSCWHSPGLFVPPLQRGGTCEAHGIAQKSIQN